MPATNNVSTLEHSLALPHKNTLPNSIHDLRERAEILRSAAEAKSIIIRFPEYQRLVDPALEYSFSLLGNVSGRTVVDLGCGSGESLPALAARGADVTGIDISPDLLTVAQERLRLTGTRARLREASVYDTGLPSNSVDVVLCLAVLHHLDLRTAHAEIYRILRPGGVVIAKEPVRDSVSYDRLRKMIPVRTAEVSSFERPLTAADIDEFAAGFDRCESKRFRLPFIPLLELIGLAKYRIVWRVDRKLLKMFPHLSRYATIEVFRLKKE